MAELVDLVVPRRMALTIDGEGILIPNLDVSPSQKNTCFIGEGEINPPGVAPDEGSVQANIGLRVNIISKRGYLAMICFDTI